MSARPDRRILAPMTSTSTTTAQPTTTPGGSTVAGAYGYVDSHGRIRAISVSRSDAIRNARLNGMPSIVHLRTTPSGTVACTGPSPVIQWEDWKTGETF